MREMHAFVRCMHVSNACARASRLVIPRRACMTSEDARRTESIARAVLASARAGGGDGTTLDGLDGDALETVRTLARAMPRSTNGEEEDEEARAMEIMRLMRKVAAGGLRDGDAGEDGDATATASTTATATARREAEIRASFVVKTRDASGTKVFANVCGSDAVGVPEFGGEAWTAGLMPREASRALEKARGREEEADDAALWFPMSCGEPRPDVDASGNPCVVVDVVFNSVVTRHAEAFKPLKRFLSQAALRRCREKYGAELDPEYRLPARKYAGARPPTRQWIRANAPVVVSSTPSAEDVLDGGCRVLEHVVDFVGRPVTSVKITATVPMDLDAKDVRACVVREGVTLDAPGFETRRIELPFMLDAASASARIVANGDASAPTIVEYQVDYLPYSKAVERARASSYRVAESG